MSRTEQRGNRGVRSHRAHAPQDLRSAEPYPRATTDLPRNLNRPLATSRDRALDPRCDGFSDEAADALVCAAYSPWTPSDNVGTAGFIGGVLDRHLCDRVRNTRRA